MKSRETLVKLRRFELNDKQQKVADIEVMIADFKRMASDLDHQIKVEQQNAGVTDVNHFAYPTFAKAAARRRDNLLASIADLDNKLAAAGEELTRAYEELSKAERAEPASAARTPAGGRFCRQGPGCGLPETTPRAKSDQTESDFCSILLFERDLSGKPVSTFPDHALRRRT